MQLRTVYLQNSLSMNGRSCLRGRVLYDRFSELSKEIILGHIILDDESYADISEPRLKGDLIPVSLIEKINPNVIFIEGGLFANNNGMWKIPQEFANELCQNGTVLIVADIDCNLLSEHKEHYKDASAFFKAYANYGSQDGKNPIYASDASSCWGGHRQIICKTNQMVISDWLRPIYKDIPAILVGLPALIVPHESILASCNQDTTGTLRNDIWEDIRDSCTFASVRQLGSGFIVAIAGLVSGDVWLEGCQYNTTWLAQTAQFLADHANQERARRTTHWKSPYLLFLSHRSTNKDIVRSVALSIKKKGVGVWFDEEELVPSFSLVDEINRALTNMTHFVLFWSHDCINAPWVNKELNSAISLLIEKKVPLIIVRLDDTPVPPIIADLYRIEAIGQKSSEIAAPIVDAVHKIAEKKKK